MLLTLSDVQERITTLSLGDLYRPASQFPRRGWVIKGVQNPETVSEHQMSAALMVTQQFRREMIALGFSPGEILAVQDTLLIHDIAEPDSRVLDRTPHDTYDPILHRQNEETVIREMFGGNTYLLNLWLNFEDGKTPVGRISKEYDKLQSIEQAWYYEDTQRIGGLIDEFYSSALIRKTQITTDFLVNHAHGLYENKPR